MDKKAYRRPQKGADNGQANVLRSSSKSPKALKNAVKNGDIVV